MERPASDAPPPPPAMRDLHAALTACDSATEALQRFFAARLTAERVRERPEAPSAARRDLLQLLAGEALVHRRSRLCARGEPVVSADLWYVPSRLPAALVAELRSTDRPFGRVMRELGLKRAVLESHVDTTNTRVALRYHALLRKPDGTIVAEVMERICAAALARCGSINPDNSQE